MKNIKNMISIVFVIGGAILLVSTYIQFGISSDGQFGYIAAGVAFIYAFFRHFFLMKRYK